MITKIKDTNVLESVNAQIILDAIDEGFINDANIAIDSGTDCPLATDSLCQKVYKIRVETDLRRYSAPARGLLAWKERFKERSSVERVIGYLKESFQLSNVRYRTGKRAKVHFDLVTMVYNGMKLASMRLGYKQSKVDLAA